MNMGWLARLAPRRLSTRIVAVFLGLLLLVQGAGFLSIRSSIEANARAAIAEDLKFGERALRSLLDRNAERLGTGARLAARDHGFVAAEKLAETDAIADALANNADRLCETGLATQKARDEEQRCRAGSAAALFDTDFKLRASTRDDLPDLSALAARLAAATLGSAGAGALANGAVVMVGGRLMQFVVAPRRTPLITGWVLAGFAIDQKLADDLREISGLHLLVLKRPDPAAPWAAPIGTLDADATGPLLARLGHAQPGPSMFAEAEEFGARSLPLAEGAQGEALAVLMRSVDEAVQPYRQLQALLAAITLAGVALFAAGSLFTARRVTTPLRALVQASAQLGRGDYGQALQYTRRSDEVGELAQAFDQMRLSIAANQTEIHRLAYWDRLTGLPNRARFLVTVQQAIDQAALHAGRLAVVMLDLDRFKHVNDVLGYAFGDRLLQAVAERLTSQTVRQGDFVARLSGNGFALLLPGGDAALALTVAERIAAAFEQALTLDEQTVDLSAGFGIACWPGHADDAEALLSRAEVAMYAAKRKSGQPVVYDPAIDAGSAMTLSLLSELRRALERDELRLFLQPKIGMASGRLVGAEALLRWQHPVRGMVPPMDFIPFAEQTGFVRQLTLWIFEAAAHQWPRLKALGLQRVSVNLSTRDLLDHELPARLDLLLRRHGVPASAFCLEITESAIMDDPQRAEAMLNRLSEQGFKLSIDDFGTGYSSLAYLKRLPVDELKIDKSFVMGMETGEDDAMIVRSTIDLAHNLGLTVVAEGVETAAILERLRILACDEAQGYHIARPLPVDDFLAWQARPR